MTGDGSVKNPPELLAPAGSVACMEEAFRYGADAVYMALPRYGARAYAENPDEEAYRKALDYAHLRGKRVYLTVNTLLKPAELAGLPAYLSPFVAAGVDAVLVQDLGVLKVLRESFPLLPLHASTQMTVTDASGARALRSFGVSRVVAAREMTLRELKALADTGIEVEAFVHGAICYCYSGQCLFSSLIGGRSGNRGKCAQPCRLPYRAEGTEEDRYLLNLKDMDTLAVLPLLLEAGVCSFKIEGRMKSPRYTGGVTAVYRKYLDLALSGGPYRVDPDDERYLSELFDRGGTTEYVSLGLHDGMVATGEKPAHRPVDEAFLRERESTFPVHEKIALAGSVRFVTGEPAVLPAPRCETRGGEGVTVTEAAQCVQPARTKPLTEEALTELFSRLGETPFQWESLTIRTDGTGFLPVGQLNALRRRTLEALTRRILASYRRELPETDADQADGEDREKGEEPEKEGKEDGVFRTAVSVDSLAQLRTLSSYRDLECIYLNLTFLTEEEEREACALLPSLRPVWLLLPPVLRESHKSILRRSIGRFLAAGAAGFLVHTLDEAAWVREEWPLLPVRADASLYTFNGKAADVLSGMGLEAVTLPFELNARELAERCSAGSLPAELVAYGYCASMVSAQCVHRTLSGCDHTPGLLYLSDRKRKRFAVRNSCRFCFNVLYNAEPLYLADLADEWRALSPARIRLSFTLEGEEEMRRVLDAVLPAFMEGRPAPNPLPSFTRGHFRRGV